MLNLTPRFVGNLPNSLINLTSLSNTTKASVTLARVFAGRGVYEPEQLLTHISRLLPADSLMGIDDAVMLIDNAIDANERILIIGDFDCDGATSTALMVRCLKAMGAKVAYLVPDRFKYGYGLTPEIVRLGIDDHQPDIIITVDNGISSHEGVNTAKAHGIKVIITDHHLTTKATPNADAVVNPNQLGCCFASKSLVGVGVAFYVLGRLAKRRREEGKSTYQVSQHLDLVALGTVADVGVLDQNNRILVYHGLNMIRQGTCCLGILALLKQAGRDVDKVTAHDFGFVLGPRINAAGRMDSMRLGIECLLSDDWEQAEQLASQLDKLNRERRQVENKMREEADAILANLSIHNDDKRSVVLYQDDWHQGVIGIVAGRLKEQYYLPSIVFAPADRKKTGDDDAIKGSARSIMGVHIRDAIEQVAEHHPTLISHFGGHAMAAGLTLKKRQLPAFIKAFEAVMAKQDNQLFCEQKFTDGQLHAQDFSLAFADALHHEYIWGHGFVAPSFDGVFGVEDAHILKDKHLKLSLSYPNVQYPIDAIWFHYDADKWDYRACQVHVLFGLDVNEWNGRQSLQLMVQDLAVMDIQTKV